MPMHRTSAGEPARTLRLLWRHGLDRSGRGPRPGLSIDRIVDTAISIADRHGLDAVTMRRVSQQLDVAPMTLYTYVPGKAELLDLMLDATYAQMHRSDMAGKGWRARARAVADDNRALFAAHPWAATISTIRPPLGPGQLAKYEHELQAFEETGLDDVQRDAALTLLLQFVRTTSLAAAEAAAASRDSRIDDEQWWAVAGPLLEQVIDPADYPTATRVGTAAGSAYGSAYSPDHAYEFGLQRILDGLGVLIEGHGSER